MRKLYVSLVVQQGKCPLCFDTWPSAASMFPLFTSFSSPLHAFTSLLQKWFDTCCPRHDLLLSAQERDVVCNDGSKLASLRLLRDLQVCSSHLYLEKIKMVNIVLKKTRLHFFYSLRRNVFILISVNFSSSNTLFIQQMLVYGVTPPICQGLF